MARYLIKICYDGTGYCGWQKQKNGLAIQEVMEKTLEIFAGKKTSLIAAGRTDAGVHSLGQYAHFDYSGSMQEKQLLLAFNRYLPDSIKVLEIMKVSPCLNARYQAYERSYRYRLAKEKTPFNRNYSGFLPHLHLNLEKMLSAAQYLLGKHDFSTFGKSNPEVPNRICELKHISISETERYFIFDFTADRFLHNMVRRIVGTLANISHLHLPPETILEILENRCPRQNLVITAPASGLYLMDVKYPAKFLDESYNPNFEENGMVNNPLLHSIK
ncbi:MAG TPA: tRNA pseudouridine(38-40) synthase TruA [Candidatus Cloacimonas acidaminovorans]|nr:tRNA pseudouridine(38-40) synthase TruA [Candidatus Cloacimonas acidaminovorans]